MGQLHKDVDFTILRSSDRQIAGINYASRFLGNALEADPKKIRQIFIEVYTAMQVQESRFHYQTENDLPQAKLALKKILEPQLKSRLNKLIPGNDSYNKIETAIDQLFQWYMKEYLTNK